MPKNDSTNERLKHLNLGQQTAYPEHYDPQQLKAVPRRLNRQPIGIEDDQLPFHGEDYWTGYEISWLNPNGLPQVAVGYFTVPANSPNLIESKSFKLYLNSFNESQFEDWQSVQSTLQRDLSACAGANITVELKPLQQVTNEVVADLPGDLLDQQDISIHQYDYQPQLLKILAEDTQQELSVKSHLLKSNCLITNQPDWGSVYIHGFGPTLCQQSLLQYLVSFRRHNEFHEQCVERIFQDLRQLGFQRLTVYARYTRRGGLDINPFRSNFEHAPAGQRLARQ